MIECPNLKDISESIYFAETGVCETNPYLIIPVVKPKIFDFEYPIFDEDYRPLLEKAILKRYYTRRICCPDLWRWKLYLDSKLNEIMPYYNELYKSALMELDPLHNFSVEVEHQDSGGDTLEATHNDNRDTSHGNTLQNESTNVTGGTDHSSSANQTQNLNKFLDTPQGRLQELENGTYLTNATKDNGSSSSSGTVEYGKTETDKLKQVITGKNVMNEILNKHETITTTRAYLEQVSGKRDISDSELIMKYRETFLMIDKMVIDELSDCFYGLYI